MSLLSHISQIPSVSQSPCASQLSHVSASPRSHLSHSSRLSPFNIRHLLCALLLLLGVGSLSGCAFYSFTGATIPSHLETIAIPIAQDNTSSPVSTLGSDLTVLLTGRFVDRTSLSLTTNDAEADALLTARIQGYRNQPTGVSGDERATTNQVTVRVQVRYVDQTNGEEMLNQTFTGVSTYNPAEAGLSGEQQALQAALENVADDIFSTATSNW